MLATYYISVQSHTKTTTKLNKKKKKKKKNKKSLWRKQSPLLNARISFCHQNEIHSRSQGARKGEEEYGRKRECRGREEDAEE